MGYIVGNRQFYMWNWFVDYAVFESLLDLILLKQGNDNGNDSSQTTPSKQSIEEQIWARNAFIRNT
jgi:hypothetical protein